jgi:hypothetical protein
MVDTYRRIVAGFLSFPKHSNTNARTVLGVAGNDSTLNTRHDWTKTSQSDRQARTVLAEKAPLAIDDQSANRSASTGGVDLGVVTCEIIP